MLYTVCIYSTVYSTYCKYYIFSVNSNKELESLSFNIVKTKYCLTINNRIISYGFQYKISVHMFETCEQIFYNGSHMIFC